jgi:hypothetical protein
MKRLIILPLLTIVLLGVGFLVAPAHAQVPPNDLKPTFLSPTPGLYVNGWPAFTVSYPKEWEEVPPAGPASVLWPWRPVLIHTPRPYSRLPSFGPRSP